MSRTVIALLSFFLVFFSLHSTLQAKTIHVDASAPAGGKGSAKKPVQTIQEGIALVPESGGTVLVEHGTYIGPILVERDEVTIQGNSTPLFDVDGFLTGFDNDVLITMDRALGGPSPEPEDIIEIRGSNNEVHNVVVDRLAGCPGPNPEAACPVVFLASAFSAKAEDDDF